MGLNNPSDGLFFACRPFIAPETCASATRSMTCAATPGMALTKAIICSAASVRLVSVAGPTLTVIQALEDDLGKPVVSSSMGQIWWPLKELGIKADIRGYGKLLGTLS